MATAAERKKQAQRRRDALAGPGTTKPTTAAAAPELRVGTDAVSPDLRKIRVIATRMGFYQHKRRRVDDVFTLVPLRTVKRATQADCDKDRKLTIGMVLKDPKTKRPIPCIKTPMEQYSSVWMEIVEEDRRPSITSVKEGMRKQHDEILLDKYPELAGQGNDDEDADPSADSGEEIDDAVVTGDTEVL